MPICQTLLDLRPDRFNDSIGLFWIVQLENHRSLSIDRADSGLSTMASGPPRQDPCQRSWSSVNLRFDAGLAESLTSISKVWLLNPTSRSGTPFPTEARDCTVAPAWRRALTTASWFASVLAALIAGLVHVVAQGKRCTRSSAFLDLLDHVGPPCVRLSQSFLGLNCFPPGQPFPGFAFSAPFFRLVV